MQGPDNYRDRFPLLLGVVPAARLLTVASRNAAADAMWLRTVAFEPNTPSQEDFYDDSAVLDAGFAELGLLDAGGLV